MKFCRLNSSEVPRDGLHSSPCMAAELSALKRARRALLMQEWLAANPGVLLGSCQSSRGDQHRLEPSTK